MAAGGLSITEQWIRDKLQLQHRCLADVRSLSLPGSYDTGKICRLGNSLKNFVRLKSLDLSHNALDSVQGLLHLNLLEKLSLYYNRISSLEDVLSLRSLQNLQELDLRLNPVMQKHPYYRLYLVHAISKLRKLDDCAVRDRERKAAVMHFSEESAQPPTQSTNLFTEEKEKRSSEARVASVKKMMMMKLSLREGNEETVLNQKCTADGSGVATREDSLFTESEPLRLAVTNRRGTAHRRPSLRSHDAPRVTFLDPYVIRHSPEHLGESAKHSRSRKQAESNFTPHPSSKNTAGEGFQALIDGRIDVKAHQSISGDRNPVLHPPRLTHRSSEDGGDPQRPPIKPNRGERLCKGAYRKPLELLLGLVDEFWAGKKENHNSRHFFMQAVQILCLMEQEVVRGEEEIKTLREKVQTLQNQAELQKRQHQSEVHSLSEQIQRAHGSVEQLDEQLRSILEENVSLQKQLIRLEQNLLSERLREMSSTGE
ncbi:centrosomal protein of 72 kDa isoform X2 [Hoplias malabaricus]|uniref:centrosomal protein of 72 kDa isoform X2 n=1 Tax=Hoplias malabaricus TaxID=27720 RepID=UPI003462CD85